MAIKTKKVYTVYTGYMTDGFIAEPFLVGDYGSFRIRSRNAESEFLTVNKQELVELVALIERAFDEGSEESGA